MRNKLKKHSVTKSCSDLSLFEFFLTVGQDNFGNKIPIIFQKEKGNTLTILIIFISKSLQKEQNITNLLLSYDPQSAGINVQLP